jgi:hypothetical protein
MADDDGEAGREYLAGIGHRVRRWYTSWCLVTQAVTLGLDIRTQRLWSSAPDVRIDLPVRRAARADARGIFVRSRELFPKGGRSPHMMQSMQRVAIRSKRPTYWTGTMSSNDCAV